MDYTYLLYFQQWHKTTVISITSVCKVHAVQKLEAGITYYWGFDIVDPVKKNKAQYT